MDKRFQVFVSSTFADLSNERQRVTQTLMEMDCIPAGMELFPAADEEQWSFIKKVIDDCDYYILILGGRYGSLTDTGISYTEAEYDYAVEKGIKVLSFVHGQPDELPVTKSETNSVLREKLINFRAKVTANRLVKFWSNSAELPGLVALSLTKTIKVHPAIGWVRANHIPTNEILIENNNLRKENELLKTRIQEIELPSVDHNLAGLSDSIVINCQYLSRGNYQKHHFMTTWEEIFLIISPTLIQHPTEPAIGRILAERLYIKKNYSSEVPAGFNIVPEDLETVRLQLAQHGLIKADYVKTTKERHALFWFPTAKGNSLMLSLRLVKKPESNSGARF